MSARMFVRILDDGIARDDAAQRAKSRCVMNSDQIMRGVRIRIVVRRERVIGWIESARTSAETVTNHPRAA